jgi:hypothetical protein
MSNPIHESIMAGTLAGIASTATIAQSVMDTGIGPWGLVLQAGNAGIVLLLLLKFIPDLMRNQREASTAHQAAMQKMAESHRSTMQNIVDSHKTTVDSLISSFENHDNAWRDLINQRGWCPVRDGDTKNQHHTER